METLWFRQAALFRRHRRAVLTVLVLLRREANSPSLTGAFEIRMPDGWETNRYNYRVVRLWGEDPESYLTAGVNLVPLAPLTDVNEDDMPGLVQRMNERISAEPRPRALKLWTAAYLLMGLRYSEDVISHLLAGAHNMQESTTYQAILREGSQEGRISEAQRLVLHLGTKRFGAPDASTAAALEAIRDVERLEALGERILDRDVRDWNSLLGAP